MSQFAAVERTPRQPRIPLLDSTLIPSQVAEQFPDSPAAWIYAAAFALSNRDHAALSEARRRLAALGWELNRAADPGPAP
jgi:hypothetical protein